MAFFKLDDFTGSCDCIMFSKAFKDFSEIIYPESTIMVKGKLESSGDTIKLHVDEAINLESVRNKFTKRLGIILDVSLHDEYVITHIKLLMEENEGNIPVLICIKENGSTREFTIDYRVNLSDKFIDSIRTLLGDDAIIYFPN